MRAGISQWSPVRDRSGKPIEGLKQGEFNVLEDGKQQKLAFFEFEKLSYDIAPPEASLTLEEQAEAPQKVQQITVKAPGQVQYQDKRLLVLFFDFAGMSIADQLRARHAIHEHRREQPATATCDGLVLHHLRQSIKTQDSQLTTHDSRFTTHD